MYVGDIIIFGKIAEHIKEIIELLKMKFDLKLLGKTKKLLGVEFENKNGKLHIHQKEHIKRIYQFFF